MLRFRSRVVAVVAASALALTACTDPEPEAPLPTLAEVVSDGVQAQPVGFCDRIDDRILDQLVGGSGATSTHYENGDKVKLSDRLNDVVHEHGCRYDGPDGQTARAWVFVPPVTSDRADALVKAFVNANGCRPSDVPGFGDPEAVALCTTPQTTVAAYRGLFTDTWFACELSDPTISDGMELLDRAGRWCAAAISAASAPK